MVSLRSFRDRVLLGTLIVHVPWLGSGTPHPEPVSGHCASAELPLAPASERAHGFPRAIVTLPPPERQLYGDYEPPKELLLAYEPEWGESVESVVRAARGQAHVSLLVRAQDRSGPLVARLSKLPGVSVLPARLDTPWVRDFGPVEVRDPELGGLWLDFDYSWERPGDDALPSALTRFLPSPVEHSAFVLDGGAVISNGRGLCAITSLSLERGGFDANASQELPALFAMLGCAVTAILPEIPDETTGHADVVAQFLASDTVAVAWADPEEHPLVANRLEEAVEALTAAADLAAAPLSVVRVPLPIENGVFHSYVNVARLQSRLLVPGFDDVDAEDEALAYQILKAAVPAVELVRIPSDKMARRGGGVHCVTLGLGRRLGARQRT